MFNLLPNVQDPAFQGDLSAFVCIHAFPLATCVKVALLVFSSWPYDLALTTQLKRCEVMYYRTSGDVIVYPSTPNQYK